MNLFLPWPHCKNASDGCPYHVCLWGSYDCCFPCEEKKVGRVEMYSRYCLTHLNPLTADTQDERDNPMIRMYHELVN